MSLHPLAVLRLATSPSPSPSLSQSTPTSPMPGESDPTWLGPGLLGFLSLLFLAIAVVVIYRSLTTQLGRVTFDEAEVNRDAPTPTAATRAAVTGGAGPDAAPTTGTAAEPTDPPV